MNWRLSAACQTAPAELFFPEDHIAPAGTKEWRAECEAIAARWCLRCPVRLECFAWSIEEEGAISRGMWGGVNFLDRKPWNDGDAPVRCSGCEAILDPLPRIRLGEDTRTCPACTPCPECRVVPCFCDNCVECGESPCACARELCPVGAVDDSSTIY